MQRVMKITMKIFSLHLIVLLLNANNKMLLNLSKNSIAKFKKLKQTSDNVFWRIQQT